MGCRNDLVVKTPNSEVHHKASTIDIDQGSSNAVLINAPPASRIRDTTAPLSPTLFAPRSPGDMINSHSQKHAIDKIIQTLL